MYVYQKFEQNISVFNKLFKTMANYMKNVLNEQVYRVIYFYNFIFRSTICHNTAGIMVIKLNIYCNIIAISDYTMTACTLT